jgi:general L-amino acid transport system substrate-binding protein
LELKQMRRTYLGLALMAVFCARPVLAATTLEQVRATGALRCGVVATPEDWNKTDLHGPLTPLSLEICKAVAVATLGMHAKVQGKPYASENEAEEGVSKHEVELSVGVTPDATSEWHWHVGFSSPIFYDGQGLLVRNDVPVRSIAELAGLKVCVIEGTDNEKILLARTVARGIAINPLPFQEEGEMDDGLAVRHCDAVSAYVSRLAAIRSAYPKQLANDKILPELLTLAPAAVAYRDDDPQWRRIVEWTIHTLVQAEASGVTQANVEAQRHSEDPVVQRLLGVDWATSRALGLEARDWGAQVISVVGNYGEIYERTIGERSSLKLLRGVNALWTNGGLMFPLPVQ